MQQCNLTNLLSPLIIIGIISLLFSCEPAYFQQDSELSKLNDFEIIDGALHLNDGQAYYNLINKFSEMTESELDEWEKSIGFISYRTVFSISADEFHLLQTHEEFIEWQERYDDILYMEDSIVKPRIPRYEDQLFVNRSGEYYIDQSYVKVLEDRVITIFDGDKSKLTIALTEQSPVTRKNYNISYRNDFDVIELRSNVGTCYAGNNRARNSVQNDKRKVYIEILTDIVEPDGYQGLGLFSTDVALRVHGHKKSIFGWNNYSTHLAYDDVGFEVIDHFGVSHLQYPVSQQTSGTAKNLYYRIFYGPLVILPNPNISQPYFSWVKGRGISSGVGDDHWAVVCCNYSYTCPSPTGPDPF